MDERKLNDEALKAISNAKSRAILVAAQADKAVAEAKVAELEYRSVIQQAFIKYGLSLNDTIDERTGIITTQSAAETEQEPA